MYAVPYVNEFGQIIQVGERVLFVSTYSHQSSVNVGHYVGVNKDDSGTISTVVVRVEPKYSWSRTNIPLLLGRVYKYVD